MQWKKVKIARLFKCRFRAFFVTISLNKNSLLIARQNKGMATEIKNKWGFQTTPECPLYELSY